MAKCIPLTDREFNEIKQHPLYSYQMIKNLKAVKEAVKVGILQHQND
ncbi:hypothetical protein IC621_06485 [Bacillus sp. IB182487]|uniref:Uncharacterized protein n=1 Tax=Metabacillus arenae TaxID=2771434 RepID=A0A926NEQ2_9BACI|nr:hypothetical protein [Metabacillus arenae]MBD1379871.1 hypothetical protein [Metabacillus arenae]